MRVKSAIELDVSEMPAPEPFHAIMTALADINQDQYLIVHHRREPKLLYGPLQEQGFEFSVHLGTKQPFEIVIWHQGDDCPYHSTGAAIVVQASGD